MKDGLYRVTTPYLCAGFVIAAGVVVACAPILRKKLAYWRTVAIRLALALLMLVVPATAQSTMGRLVITDGSTQSDYGPPAADRNVICPVCAKDGKKSTVRRWTEPTTYGFSYTPSINYYKSEARYWDEDGRYHDHELAQELLVCSTGHRFYDYDDRRCWCGFPNDRYVVVDAVKGETITLPEGDWKKTYTPNGMFITPASYLANYQGVRIGCCVGSMCEYHREHPIPTDKDSLTVQKFDRSFWFASGLWFGASSADLVTTKFALDRGGIERNVLHAEDGGHKLRWTSAIAATGGTWAFSAYCERKGHRRIARGVLIAGAVVRTGLAFWNHSRRR